MNQFINNNKTKVEELKIYIENNNNKNALIMILHKTQDLFGYIPKEIIEIISASLDIPTAKIYGVVTFYSRFSTTPKGKHTINVCLGTACFVKGANEILEEFKKELKINDNETTKDNLFTLETLRCVGTCGLAPVVMVDDKVFGNVKIEDVKDIIEQYRKMV